MTGLDATYDYAPAPSGVQLAESTQRVLMALMTFAVIEMLVLSNPLLTQFTGYAEPDNGLVWIGLAGPEGVDSRRVQLPGGRERVRSIAVQTALNMLRLRLLPAEKPAAGKLPAPQA